MHITMKTELCFDEDFTYVKFTTQLFSSTDEPLKDETRLLLS